MKKLIIAVLFIFMLPLTVQAQDIVEPEVTVPKNNTDSPTLEQVGPYPVSTDNYPASSFAGGDWRRYGHGVQSEWGDYAYASTAAEGYLSARGRLYRGYGQYLVSSGKLLNLYQDARHKVIINHRDAVHTWWQLKDEYRERFRRDHPPWPDMKLHQLNMTQRRYDVLQLEKQMIQQGVLPPKQKPSFTFNGKKYASYAEFKNSPEWIFMRLGVAERQKKKTSNSKVIQKPITKKKFEQIW